MGFTECLPIVLLPCIMKWSGLQDLLIWLLTWNHKFLLPLHAACRIYEIEFRLNSKFWDKIQEWYAMLLEVQKKGHKFVLKNMTGTSNKNLQKQSLIGVLHNACSADMRCNPPKLPTLLKLIFCKWCNYIIFMHLISKCRECIVVCNYEISYPLDNCPRYF